MPVEKSITVYQDDELTPAAQAIARDWYREVSAGDTDFAEYLTEDLQTICGILGITIGTRDARTVGGKVIPEPRIYWSGFASQGDGACFEGTWGIPDPGAGAIKDHAPEDMELRRIADTLWDLQAKYDGGLSARVTHTGRYYHARSVEIEVDASTPEGADRIVDTVDGEAVREALRDLMRWFYCQLEAEYEYQQSDEAVTETIRANDYEFEIDGRRARV